MANITTGVMQLDGTHGKITDEGVRDLKNESGHIIRVDQLDLPPKIGPVLMLD